jgi:hypothetical protein
MQYIPRTTPSEDIIKSPVQRVLLRHSLLFVCLVIATGKRQVSVVRGYHMLAYLVIGRAD